MIRVPGCAAGASGLRELRWELGGKLRRAGIDMRIRAPAEVLGSVQNLLDAHLQNDIGMCADPWTARGDLSQQRIERSASLAAAQRIDPDEDTVHAEQLRPHLIGEVLVIDRRLGRDAERRQLLEYAVIAIVLRSRGLSRVAIAAP